MSDYSKFLGLEYVPGRQDCYSIVRQYYEQNLGVRLRNYARPDYFWEDPNLDLYQMFTLEGAYAVHDNSIQIGDVILVSLMTQFAAHALIVVDDNVVLHHPPGQLSCLDALRPKWMNRALATIRHPGAKVKSPLKPELLHLHEVVDAQLFKDPGFQETVARVLGS